MHLVRRIRHSPSRPALLWRGLSSLRAGLFGIDGLHEPRDFLRLAKEAQAEAERLRSEVRDDGSHARGALGALSVVDRVSNVICKAIDPAELCRQVHAEEAWRSHADAAFGEMNRYINEINMDAKLHKALKRVCDDEAAMASFTEEQRRMAQLMLAELERGGIHLGSEDRAEFLRVSDLVSELESEFQQNLTRPPGSVTLPKARDAVARLGLPESVLGPQKATQDPRDITVVLYPPVALALLRYCSDPSARRQVYKAFHAESNPNVRVLQRLIAARHRCAEILGFASHAHRSAGETMAGAPEPVIALLEELGARLGPICETEHRQLRLHKNEEEGGGRTVQIRPWDLTYYMQKAQHRGSSAGLQALWKVFSLASVTKGLQDLCEALFGVELRDMQFAPGERWDGKDPVYDGASLKKFGIYHDGRCIGVIFLDLLPRPGKYSHSAHFTIHGGCVSDHLAPTPEYQVPSVAMIFNFGFGIPEGSNEVFLLHSELETLLHEFGHALHSALSKTEYQHLSGTRVPVDFVETPSHLFEHFVWDHRVLQSFASSQATGSAESAVPAEALEAMQHAKTQFAGIDTQKQVLYALVDQHLFGARGAAGLAGSAADAEEPAVDVLGISYTVQKELGGLPVERGDAWCARFGHYTGYSSGYYGYLYARVYASQIWAELFKKDPRNRDAGMRIWRDVLAKGNARDPKLMLQDVMGKTVTVDSFLKDLKG